MHFSALSVFRFHLLVHPGRPQLFASMAVLCLCCLVVSFALSHGFSLRGRVNIVNEREGGIAIRHCNANLYACDYRVGLQGPPQDFLWDIVDALNGEPTAISFRSVNYPNTFIAFTSSSRPGRLAGLSSPNRDDASFVVLPQGNSKFAFQTLSKVSA